MYSHLKIELFRDCSVLAFLAFLVLTVSVFSALHLLYNFANSVEDYEGIFDSYWLSISAERGFAEIFNYIQCLILIFFLFGIYRKNNQPVYLVLTIIYSLALIDDIAALHEKIGLLVSGSNDEITDTGIRPQDYGEFLVLSVAGLSVLAVMLYSVRKTGKGHLRFAALFGVCLGILVLFGVVVDFFSRMLAVNPVAVVIGEIVEDGGEMLAIALACALAMLIYRSDELSNPPDPPRAVNESNPPSRRATCGPS